MNQFPHPYWSCVLEASMVYAIRNIRIAYPSGISFQKLIKISDLQQHLKYSEKDLQKKIQSVEDLNHNNCYHKPHTRKKKVPAKSARNLPKHLKKVKSRIRNEVAKDIAIYSYRAISQSEHSLNPPLFGTGIVEPNTRPLRKPETALRRSSIQELGLKLK